MSSEVEWNGCAGEDEAGIRPTLDKLSQYGIGAILDYAAEDDSDEGEKPSRGEVHGSVVARTYDYETESSCDRHKDIFMRSIRAAADAPGQGFAAIKAGHLSTAYTPAEAVPRLSLWTGSVYAHAERVSPSGCIYYALLDALLRHSAAGWICAAWTYHCNWWFEVSGGSRQAEDCTVMSIAWSRA